jgi:hypothetical protein
VRAHGVDVSVTGNPEMTVLTKGNVLKAYQFPDRINRPMVHALHRLFEIPIHHFYNPDLTKL